MSDYLTRACKKLGVDESQVLAYNVDADRIALVVDYGVAGGKKYTYLLEELPGGWTKAVDLSALTVTELQEIAKERGISFSGMRKAELVAALET